MQLTRRDFLASGLVATASGVIVPPVLAKSVFAATASGIHNNRVLVVLQLAGGNDGLNCVVPYATPAYHDARPTIAIDPAKVLHLDATVGLNPVMTGIKALYDAGRVAVVQGVGYDNPSYSHFESVAVWEHADPQRRAGDDGWLGGVLRTQLDSTGHPLTACALGQAGVPGELRAPDTQVSVIQSVKSYQVQGGAGRQVAAPALYRRTPGLYGALFDQALATAQQGIKTVQTTTYRPAVSYTKQATVYGSKNDLAASMQLCAQMIVTEPTTKLCHIVLGGWDTHQDEGQRQTALLAAVDTAVAAFMKDLDAHGMADRVTLMTWSEFGRRVHENGSKGTDHGSAAPMFVIGKQVRGGIYGEAPSLSSLMTDGNLKYTVDFRSVYQVMIRDWLQGDPRAVLGASYPDLPLVRAA